MKTVLLITTEESQRMLYEPCLKKHFAVEFSPKAMGGSGSVDAVVYDLPKYPSSVDFEWLEALDLPVVVLTPEKWLRLPSARNQLVLVFPVGPSQMLQALSELGVRADD